MPLYAFIDILLYFSFILKIVICTHLLILSLIILYLVIYLLPKVSYIYFTYRIRARGVGWLGRFWGRFRGFGRLCPLIGRFVDSWRAFGAFCVRVRACFPVRAGVRGCTPTIFCARPIPGSLPSHSVRRICGGVSRGVRVSASECVYCIIFSA